MKRIAVCMLFIGIALISREGFAQGDTSAAFTCPERPDKEPKARKLAGTFFSEAEEAYSQEDYEEALAKFCCSLVMVEHPNTIINIEKTLDQLTTPEKMLSVLKTTLKQLSESELRSKIEQIAAELEGKVAAAAIENTPKCPVVEAPPAVSCPSPELPAVEADFRKRAHKLMFITGWTGVGIGAASFITAIVFQALAGSAKNRAQETVSYQVFLDERDKNRSFQTAATTAFVGSVLTAGIGVAQLVLLADQQKKYDEKKRTLTPQADAPIISLMPGFGRLDMEVTF